MTGERPPVDSTSVDSPAAVFDALLLPCRCLPPFHYFGGPSRSQKRSPIAQSHRKAPAQLCCCFDTERVCHAPGYKLFVATHCTAPAAKKCAAATGQKTADVISVYSYSYNAAPGKLGKMVAGPKAVLPVPQVSNLP